LPATIKPGNPVAPRRSFLILIVAALSSRSSRHTEPPYSRKSFLELFAPLTPTLSLTPARSQIAGVGNVE
jgi:hypothetical protein